MRRSLTRARASSCSAAQASPTPHPTPIANPHPHPNPDQTAASSYYEGNFDDHVTTTEAMRREGEEDSGSEVAGPAYPSP